MSKVYKNNKTIDCLIHGERGVSFSAADGGPHSWDQPTRAIMDSQCPGSVTEEQEREPVLHTHLPCFITVAWERLSGENFLSGVAPLFACCSPHLMSDPFTRFKHLPFGAASGDFCAEGQAGLSQHRIAAPLHSGTKCSIQGPESPVRRLLFLNRAKTN